MNKQAKQLLRNGIYAEGVINTGGRIHNGKRIYDNY